MHFADRLVEAIQKKNSVVCVGLDPRLAQMPAFLIKKHVDNFGPGLTAVANAFLDFGKGIIDAVKDKAVAIKPQLAFYEEYGFQGIWALEETCRYAKEQGLLVIVDGKRNDIGSTAEAYARAFLSGTEIFGEKVRTMEADALTVNAYLGWDGIKPFADACAKEDKGIFILVKTSNPSSGDIQDRRTEDEKMSIANLMAHFVEAWGSDSVGSHGYSSIGAVVGATYPGEAKHLRAIMPETFFLVPGYGAQGGSADDTKPCFNEDGLGAIVNSSRGIIFAYENNGGTKGGEDYAEAARDAAELMRQELNRARA